MKRRLVSESYARKYVNAGLGEEHLESVLEPLLPPLGCLPYCKAEQHYILASAFPQRHAFCVNDEI